MRRIGILLVVFAAAGAGDYEGLPEAIREGLLGNETATRAATVRKLARIETEAATAALRKLVRHDPAAAVRQEAAVALARRGPDPSLALELQEALGAKDWWLRWRAALALGALGKEASFATTELIEALGDKEPEVSGAAARALAKIAPRDYVVVNAIVDALVNDKAKRDVPALLAALQAANVPLPKRAALWLGRVAATEAPADGRAARAFLIRTQRDWFRLLYSGKLDRTAAAIDGAMRPEFRPFIVPLLARPEFRFVVLRAIGIRSEWARGCAPLVVPHAADKNGDIRTRAQSTLTQLGYLTLGKCLGRVNEEAALAIPPRGTKDRAKLLVELSDRALLEAVAKLVKTKPDELLAKFTR